MWGVAFFVFMSPPILTDVELKWLIKKTGVVAPRDDLKRRYYLSQGAVGYSIRSLEISWLQKTIGGLGQTPVSKYDADLLKQLVGLSGYSVSTDMNPNTMTFYLNT